MTDSIVRGAPRRWTDYLTTAHLVIGLLGTILGGFIAAFALMGFRLVGAPDDVAVLTGRVSSIETRQQITDSLFTLHVKAERDASEDMVPLLEVMATGICIAIPPSSRQGIRLPCAKLISGEPVTLIPRGNGP